MIRATYSGCAKSMVVGNTVLPKESCPAAAAALYASSSSRSTCAKKPKDKGLLLFQPAPCSSAKRGWRHPQPAQPSPAQHGHTWPLQPAALLVARYSGSLGRGPPALHPTLRCACAKMLNPSNTHLLLHTQVRRQLWQGVLLHEKALCRHIRRRGEPGQHAGWGMARCSTKIRQRGHSLIAFLPLSFLKSNPHAPATARHAHGGSLLLAPAGCRNKNVTRARYLASIEVDGGPEKLCCCRT